MAAGPQSPLWLSAKLSHLRTLRWSSFWNPSDVSASPSTASVIWTPAGEHQVSLSSDAKTAFGFLTMSTSTRLR